MKHRLRPKLRLGNLEDFKKLNYLRIEDSSTRVIKSVLRGSSGKEDG